jgi:lysophospholipase L1-like esterase
MSHPPAARLLALLGIAVLVSGGSGLAGLPAVATASPGAAAPAAAPLTGKHYVALGDSFTADWGVDPVAADQPSTGCRQSTNDYPHQVAANLGLKLTHVSCAGATTVNMTQPQTTFPDGLSHPEAKPQFDALKETTEIVTIGIGGNDFGFGDIAGTCAVNPFTAVRLRRQLEELVHHLQGLLRPWRRPGR